MRRLLGCIAALACAAVPFTVAIDHAAATTAQCASPTGVKVNAGDSPATVIVEDTTMAHPIVAPVLVTITGTTFTVASTEADVTATVNNWCVKSSTSANFGTGNSGASTATNKKGVVQDIGYVVLLDVSLRPHG
jgi:hypothetical protein